MSAPFTKNRGETQTSQPGLSGIKNCVFLMSDSLETGVSERQFAAVSRSINRDVFDVELACLQRRGPFLDGLREITEFPLGGSFFNTRAHRSRLKLAHRLKKRAKTLAENVMRLLRDPGLALSIARNSTRNVNVFVGSGFDHDGSRSIGQCARPCMRVVVFEQNSTS
jgi:hypothetical protein